MKDKLIFTDEKVLSDTKATMRKVMAKMKAAGHAPRYATNIAYLDYNRPAFVGYSVECKSCLCRVSVYTWSSENDFDVDPCKQYVE